MLAGEVVHARVRAVPLAGGEAGCFGFGGDAGGYLGAVPGQHRERFDRHPVLGGGIGGGVQAPRGFPDVFEHVDEVNQDADGDAAAEKAAEGSHKKISQGLEPKTVVNTHRMLHRAWEEFTAWGWAKRNLVSDAHPPRVPCRGRKVWTIDQLQTFLIRAQSDRFFALWVLEATSGMRRCELAGAHRDLLDLAAGTLAIEATRVVVDGKVIESDGKTENAQHLVALDPFTLAALAAHVETLDRERKDLGPDYQDHGLLFCWENGAPPHPDTITRRFKKLSAAAGLPEIDLHDVRHSYATAGRNAKIDWKALSKRIGHADVAFTMKQYVQTDLEADRQVANTLAELIIGGALASFGISRRMGGKASGEGGGEAA